jgi:hypothetical protein
VLGRTKRARPITLRYTLTVTVMRMRRWTRHRTRDIQHLGEESSQAGAKGPVMALMSGFLRYHTFRVRGVLQGHKVTILIDGGASHNFIDANMVERRGI